MKELLGKTITELRVNENQSILVFITTEDTIAYKTVGDCCSETWFADIENPQALFNNTVQFVNELDLIDYNTNDGRSRQDKDEAYGYCLRTEKGDTKIIFRNSSNGHYGGEITISNDYPPIEDMDIIITDWYV